jgi:hypothetical protein
MRNLVVMLGKALELAGIERYRASAGWDWIGYYLEGTQFWIGIEYKFPQELFLTFHDAKPDLDRFRQSGRGAFDSKGQAYYAFDLRNEAHCFLARSADGQLDLLRQFVESAFRDAREVVAPSTTTSASVTPSTR